MHTTMMRILTALLAALLLLGPALCLAEKKGGEKVSTSTHTATREKVIDGHRVKIDMTKQVLMLNLPEDREFTGRERKTIEPPLIPTLGKALEGRSFMSASVLAAKAKQFDDGLYAAVDVAAQDGCGTFAGKKEMLMKITQALKKEAATEQGLRARALIFAAARLGGQAPREDARIVNDGTALEKEFMANELRSKPIGFYTWNESLGRIFRQDRILQEPQKTAKDAMPLATAIRDSGTRDTYAGYMTLNERLTNPLIKEVSDLRPLIEGKHVEGPFAMFPPSRAHETELIKRLYGSRPIPEGFDLMNKLVEEIQKGTISLKPGKDSGWYDYQTWALEPLVLPEKTAEAAKLNFGDEYKKELINLFKSLLALTRETHIKQLEIPACGAGMPEKAIDVYPDLTIEPLVTYYHRRAESYAFVRKVLEGMFGAAGLEKMHRLTKNGPVKASLAAELRDMERLFEGASQVACFEIGCPLQGAPSMDALVHARTWMKTAGQDPDVGADNRMMVPVFFDLMRKKTKVWVVMGYASKPLEISYLELPTAEVLDKAGKKTGTPVLFHSTKEQLTYPVMAEVYVKKILNRDEFRKICDGERTASKILAAIQK